MTNPSNPAVDQFGKVTVSLGGRCPLACLHCYTTAPSFHVDRKRSVDEAIALLKTFSGIEVICLSGDTDPFLRAPAAVDLLERAAGAFPAVDLMYTTRLIPSPDVEERLLMIGNAMAVEGRLFVAAVSLVTPEYPNAIENMRLVPDPRKRSDMLARLSRGRQPVMLALRPTFPFEVVSANEVARMIDSVAGAADVVLGEVMLLDSDGVITDQLGMAPALPEDELGGMTFMQQPASWRKRSLTDEVAFARGHCAEHGIPYFMRSISAMRYFRRYWDFEQGRTLYEAGDPLDLTAEPMAP